MVVTLPHYRGAMKYYWLKKSIIMLLISSKDMKPHANWNVLWDCRVSVKENAIFRCIRLAKEKCQGPWKSSSMLGWVAKRIIEKLPNFSVKRPNLTSEKNFEGTTDLLIFCFYRVSPFGRSFNSCRFGLKCIKPSSHLALTLALTLTLKPPPTPTSTLTLNKDPLRK